MTRKPLILALETSGRIGSVALALGEQLLAEKVFSLPMKHSVEILPAAQTLLQQFNRTSAEIEHIYISIGPGSVTGLHIAVTTAKMMCLANAARIIPIGTLDVIAANITEQPDNKFAHIERIVTILDAKRGQFFIAAYQKEKNLWNKILPDSIMTAKQFLEKFTHSDPPIWLLGEGLVYHTNSFIIDGIRFIDKQYWNPQAAKVHSLGWKKTLKDQFADPLTLTPFYLRGPEVKEKCS